MSAAGRFLRNLGSEGHAHWCPGCGEAHRIPASWTFDGNLLAPTFTPSVKITGMQRVIVNGEWTGEWKRDAMGAPLPGCCHYFVTGGLLKYCGDSTHALAGQTLPLPEWPADDRAEA